MMNDVLKKAMLGSPKDSKVVTENVLEAYKYDVRTSSIKARAVQYLRWHNLVVDMYDLLLLTKTDMEQLIEQMKEYCNSLSS